MRAGRRSLTRRENSGLAQLQMCRDSRSGGGEDGGGRKGRRMGKWRPEDDGTLRQIRIDWY